MTFAIHSTICFISHPLFTEKKNHIHQNEIPSHNHIHTKEPILWCGEGRSM